MVKKLWSIKTMEYYSAVETKELLRRNGGKLNAYYKVKEAIVKGHMLYDLGIITLWKRQNCGGSEKISGCQEGSVGRE